MCRVFQNICRIPGILQLLIGLGSSYNVQAILNVLLIQMIPLATVVNASSEHISDETSDYFTLLTELLRSVDLDSTLVNSVIRFVWHDASFLYVVIETVCLKVDIL